MRLSTLTIIPVVALLLMSAITGVVVATSVPFHAQQSPNGTPGTEVNGTATTTSTPSTTGGASGQGNGPSVTFNDQESSGQSVHIQSVTIPEPGFVTIYDSSRSGSETNQIVGTFYLVGSGTFTDFDVPLDTPVNESASLTAVIHTDSNNNGRFDYVSSNGSQDAPLTPQGDRRIVDIAQVTVQSQSGSGGANTTEAASSADESTTTTASNANNGDTNGTDENASGGSGGSSGFGPGFGFVIGVVALLAIALIAVARN